MPAANGVYVLVLNLEMNQAISIGRAQTALNFDAGWYIYVGSAFGAGGLMSRILRHRKLRESGKKLHWQVDYFREYASIAEVWCCQTPSSRWEHIWARAWCSWPGASVPLRRFGASDCRSGCDAHLILLNSRPNLSEFRDSLLRRFPEHPEIESVPE
jgi:Uri superfamily endonuclease